MTKIIKHKKAHNSWFAILDIFVTIFSYFLAYFLTNLLCKDYFTFSSEYVIMLLLIIPTWLILLQMHNLTQIPRIHSHISMFFNLLNFSFVGFVLIFLYKHLFNLTNFSHFVIISFSIVNLVSLYLFRIATYRIFKYFRVSGHNICNIIVYADDRSNKFLDDIIEHKEWGFSILMIISDSMFIKKKYGPSIRIYPDKININNIFKFVLGYP